MSEMDTDDCLSERYIEKYVEWKIPNFLSLPQKRDERLISALFDFLDATWYLAIYPRGEKEDFGAKYIKVSLIKEDCNGKIPSLSYRIGINNRDSSEYVTSSEAAEFKIYQSESENEESEDEDATYESEDEDATYESEYEESEDEDDISESANDWSQRGIKLLERSVLRKNRSELLPQGVLTIFCILRCTDKGGMKETNNRTVDFEKLSADYRDLFLSGNGSDATLKVQDREFKVHKTILRARSKVFDSMFTHDMKENNTGIVTISDCVPEAIDDLLLYMYCGKVRKKISTNNMFDLYHAADKYDVVKLKEKCLQFMMDSLSVETFCDALTLALRYNESVLLEEAKTFFVKNEKEIIIGAQWLSFVKDHPVEANELHIKSLDTRNSLYTKLSQRYALLSNKKNPS